MGRLREERSQALHSKLSILNGPGRLMTKELLAGRPLSDEKIPKIGASRITISTGSLTMVEFQPPVCAMVEPGVAAKTEAQNILLTAKLCLCLRC
jgi:hypothetical protein